MNYAAMMCAVGTAVLVAACSTPQERAARAQEKSYKLDAEIKRERLNLLEEYKECVESKRPGTESQCDYLLKAAEAIR